MLRDAYRVFHLITTLPAFMEPSHSDHPHSPLVTIPALLAHGSSSYSIYNLHRLAGRHSQAAFSRALFTALTDAYLRPDSEPLHRARIRHACHPTSTALFSAYTLPESTALSDRALQFLVAHRTGLPIPFLPHPPPLHCHPRCSHHPPANPYPPGHFHHRFASLALHPITCGIGGFRHARHDALTRLLAEAASTEAGYLADTTPLLVFIERHKG